jgi:NAD(P)-dependent dehydrogenase (short-subunit alcohol dehydrogenase family)
MSFPVYHRYTYMTQLLRNKNAIIYGAGGDIGRGVATTFAREGARLFLVGRTREALETTAHDVVEAGGEAEVATFDVFDEAAVAAHVAEVVARVGRVDVSFNLIARGDVQGQPFLDISVADLTRPVINGLRASAITARAAARHMVGQGSGVILYLTSGSSAGLAPMMGGTGPADAATETYMRYLASEVGPSGVRVVGLWTAGVVETLTRAKMADVAGDGVPDPEIVIQMIANAAMLRRAPRLDDVADTAAFLASDRAAGITATIVNVTSGLVAR